MNPRAARWIRRLGLVPHAEGGFYRETYRSDETLSGAALPRRYRGPRAFSTSILFLLEGRGFSAFHRLKSDETWHFHAGGTLRLHLLDPKGRLFIRLLGNGTGRGVTPQVTAQRGTWLAATLARADSYALVGCTVAPGFEFEDWELADAGTLAAAAPRHRAAIERLCLAPARAKPARAGSSAASRRRKR